MQRALKICRPDSALTNVIALDPATSKYGNVAAGYAQGLEASLRMRLDTAQLPKPFQLNAIASRDWTLASDWHRWIFTP